MDRLTTAQVSLRSVARLSPALASRMALGMFFDTRPRMPLHPDHAETDIAATRRTLSVRDASVRTYAWGAGMDAVLLVHGWRGRASQFAPLVRELVSEGLRVGSFDAPAHGASSGRHADIRDWLDTIRQLERLHGPFRVIVGHSFGALAALTAVREGVQADGVAAVSGAGSAAVFLERFGELAAIPAPVRRRMSHDFARRVGESESSVGHRFDAVAHPLPAHVELLAVHDEGDRQVPLAASEALAGAHTGRARLVRTSGYGHGRILSADPALDAIVSFARGGLRGIPSHAERSERESLDRPAS